MKEIFHGEEFQQRRNRRRSIHELTRFYCGGSKNVQATDSDSETNVSDFRRAVGDQGVLAEGGAVVDQSVNDNRTFDDHSVFAVDGSDRSVSNDYSVTNIMTADADIARANADAAIKAFAAAATVSDKSLSTLGNAVEDAFAANRDITAKGLDAVSQGNLKAFEFARGAGSDALDIAAAAFDKAAAFVAKDAADSRDFAGQFVGRVFDSAKSADQQNVETITKALTQVAVAAAIVLGLRALSRK